MKLRLERLLIPYIIFPIIVWIINNVIFFIFKFNRFNRFLTINQLKIQLIVARGIVGMGALWFIFNLLVFTFIFFISSILLKKKFLFYFQIISLISYIIQYRGINFRFFSQYTSKIWMSVGNLIETLPIAIFAFSLSSNNMILIFSKNENKKRTCFFCSFFFYLLSNYNIFEQLTGYASPGIKPIIISFFLFTIFYTFPFENINSKILYFISYITKYTQGIYCLHCLFLLYMRRYFEKKGTFVGTNVLYIICYFTSFIGFKIFAKTKLKYLFI
jgi:hypothetical protein